MKVLILSHYFVPENPPGAHRFFSLAKKLVEQGHEVEVLTANPNYPNLTIFEGYKNKLYQLDTSYGFKVHRAGLYLNAQKRIYHRIFSLVSFVITSSLIGVKKISKPDLIICLSPPISDGITGMFLKTYFRCKMVLNVADLWPESGIKLGFIKHKILIKLLEKFEFKLYQSSDGIACQTMGILNHINRIVPHKPIIWFRNGVDFHAYGDYIINPLLSRKFDFIDSSLVVGYAGIIGYAQGLEVLLNALEILKDKIKIFCIIVGDGPKLNELRNLSKEKNLENIIFLGNQSKSNLPTILKKIDVSIVPLKKTDLFKGALPSKIFDSYAIKKPVLLGVDGEARELFCNHYKCAFYYEPDNHFELAKVLTEIFAKKEMLAEMGEIGYNVMLKDFNRDIINIDIIDFLKKIIS